MVCLFFFIKIAQNANLFSLGDSGSALICSTSDNVDFIVGIVSYGSGCGSIESAGVYQSTIYHRQWIEETLKNDMKLIEMNKQSKI